ncbi:MAG: cytochrome c [Nevskia sp.]|nr:cytochrome c [Nevskia sp.]
MKLLKGALLALGTLIVAGGLFVASGIYDVGADSPHTRPVEWLLQVLRERSTDAHGDDIKVPPLDDAKLIAEGAEHYGAMCAGCHLGPGVADNEFRVGLYPKPPLLYQQHDEEAGEQFWIIKHGIKFTAMPAWGATHDDQKLWAMVAFLQKLPKLTPEQYAQLTAHAEDRHEHDQPH